MSPVAPLNANTLESQVPTSTSLIESPVRSPIRATESTLPGMGWVQIRGTGVGPPRKHQTASALSPAPTATSPMSSPETSSSAAVA